MQERFNEFTVLVANINRCIHKIKSEEMRGFDLKSSHVSCLYYVYKFGTLTATELCLVCGEDKANVSRAIKFLEERGYLECPTKGKRYQSSLTLTDSGKKIGAFIKEKIDNVLEVASRGVSDEERQIMYKSLNLINENLSKICDEY